MAVQARFFVQSTTRFAYNLEQLQVELAPVTRGSVNAEWAKYTPSGKITLSIMNDSAATWFNERLGQEIAITFDDRPEGEVDTP
jgi:hypothetical protein